jgi:hypothetical protein
MELYIKHYLYFGLLISQPYKYFGFHETYHLKAWCLSFIPENFHQKNPPDYWDITLTRCVYRISTMTISNSSLCKSLLTWPIYLKIFRSILIDPQVFPRSFRIIACTKLAIQWYNSLVTAYFAKYLYLNEFNCSFYSILYTVGAIFITRKISYQPFGGRRISFFSVRNNGTDQGCKRKGKYLSQDFLLFSWADNRLSFLDHGL